MAYITIAKMTTNVLTAKEIMALVLKIVRYGRKRKRDYQTKTYSKYPLSRSKKECRDYKISGNGKKYPNNQNTKLLCVKQVQLQNRRWLPSL